MANEAAMSNQNLYHFTAGSAFSLVGSRFSLGVEYSCGSKGRSFGFGGLPPSVPVIGPLSVATRTGRWVFVLGYVFGTGR